MTTLVRMKDIVKRFPGVLAVDHVDFDLNEGEVHCLIGANGAGKSTLIKILAGVYSKDEGTIEIEGKPVEIRSPKHAQELGIATIYQEYNLVPYLSVAENISLGHLPSRFLPFGLRLVDWKATIKFASELLQELQVDISPVAPVWSLGVGQQQMVEIAKALALKARIYIMDEPTAALSSGEIEKLFQVIRYLKERGCGVIYISHRLEEVGIIGDRVTVMRDGRKVATLSVSEASHEQLVELMVGRSVSRQERYTRAKKVGKPLLQVYGLTRKGVFSDVNLEIRAGEIVGLAGVVGSGRTEVARAIFGADPVDAGRIILEGKVISIRSPCEAVKCGICYLPEDRRQDGLVLCCTVADNVVLASLSKFSRLRVFLDRARVKKEVMSRVQELNIKTPSLSQCVEYLSGGNQQKVVVAKWLSANGKVFLFDEPTRGIDVGAKVEIFNIIRRLADQGAGILLISSEIDELVALCDRVYVLREGRLVAELVGEEITKERILAIAVTGKKDGSLERSASAGKQTNGGGVRV
uniref:Sugar ABC transporter ATP-binding protein n=1 Tax=Candidatus Methanosuratincola petrocarbonis (ex Vanwonterghem et al. 2016) TaxID=1867261 RepID=A0A7J3V050_9CREN